MNKKKALKTALKYFNKKKEKGIAFINKMERADVPITEEPHPSLFVIHNSDADQKNFEILRKTLESFGQLSSFVMVPGMKYSYVAYNQMDSAIQVYTSLNTPESQVHFYPKPQPVILLYTPLLPHSLNLGKGAWCLPSLELPGLSLVSDYIDEDLESHLIECIDNTELEVLTNRKVVHFGYDHVYGAQNINEKSKGLAIPGWLDPLLQKLHDDFGVDFDQVTIDDYMPGDSIPNHTDSHSPFEELILTLSLRSGIAMNFKRENSHFSLYLPPRGLMSFSGEVRYAWTHGIPSRKFDILDGHSVYRTQRTSLTFRKLRLQPCNHPFTEHSDQSSEINVPESSGVTATRIEKEFVYDTYNKIASHFSNTRYKPWPKVEAFLASQSGFVLDIGCGNGKYLFSDPLMRIGTDRSDKLLEICSDRGFNVFTADCLNLPVRSEVFDTVVCIAVIHHLSSQALRVQSLREILRVLVFGGKALIYVWAKEQSERTFTAQDNLVPWTMSNSSEVYQRFYHVFVQGELEQLVEEAYSDTAYFAVTESYFDKSNWCVVLTKVKKS